MDAGVVLIGVASALLLGYAFPTVSSGAALIVSVAAGFELVRGLTDRTAFFLAGICSGLAATLHVNEGLSFLPAVLLSVPVPLAAMLFAKRAEFAAPLVRQQALLGLAFLGPCLAAAPGIISGWRSAVALNRIEETAGNAIPSWTWQFAALALALGLLRSLWKHR